MSVLKIGKVRPTYKGEWNAETAYDPLDWVLYRGVAYQALGDVPVNREPDVNPDYWVQTGMKGDKGDKGEPGERGPAGVDGRDGAEGAQGAMGPTPGHRWDGSKLAFQNPDGNFAPSVDLRGPQGPMGPEGPQGPQGVAGPAGAQGPQGPQGVKGDTGATPALNNTVTSTSTVQAATANAVKTAYDKAVAAMPKTGGTFTGPVDFQFTGADAPIRLDADTGAFRILRRNADGTTAGVFVFDPAAGTINSVNLNNVPLAQTATKLQAKRVITLPAGAANGNPLLTVEFDGSGNATFQSGCAGNCTGACTSCTGTCAGSCVGSCVGSCAGCTGTCTGSCVGSCTGSCTGCTGTCLGSCTSCTGTCTGRCGGCGGCDSSACTGR